MGAECYHHLKAIIKKKYGLDACNVGDEGGFAPSIQDNFEGLELLKQAIEKAGYTGRVQIGMDVAASEFWKEDAKKYDLDFKNAQSDKTKWITSDQLADIYKEMVKRYPIITIEDPFDQDDWNAWTKFTHDTTPLQVSSFSMHFHTFEIRLNASHCLLRSHLDRNVIVSSHIGLCVAAKEVLTAYLFSDWRWKIMKWTLFKMNAYFVQCRLLVTI